MKTKLYFIFINLILFNIELSYCQNFVDSLGRKQGVWVFEGNFDSALNIRPIVHCNFINDTLINLYRKFDRSNNLRYEVNYDKGKRIGLGQVFDNKKNIIFLVQYEDGFEKTIFRFSKNRRIYEIIEFDQGEKNGLNIIFYNNGQPFIKRFYKKGKLNGNYIIYKRNGKIKSTFYYINDLFYASPNN